MPNTSSSMIQVLIQFLQCDRRAPKSTATAQTESNVKLHNEPPKSCKDSEPGDLSTTDYVSDDGSQGQTDCSSETMEFRRWRIRPSAPQPPPGLAPPPGLDAPVGQSYELATNRQHKYWEGVISHRPKQTTHQAETSRSHCAEAPWRMERGGRRPKTSDQPSLRQRHLKQPTSSANDPLVALKESLDRLAPTEIATLRSLLDSNIHNAGAGNTSRNLAWAFGADAKPAQNRKPDMSQADTGGNLHLFLRELNFIDDSRVVAVRKINALGFNSAPMLQDYFSKFGTVERVMVPPPVVKSRTGSRPGTRTRPAPLGFVVMSTSAEADSILNHEETHNLDGVDIETGPFKSHSIGGTD